MVRNEQKSVRRPLRALPNNNHISQINSYNGGGGGGGGFSKSMKVSKKSISNPKKDLENQVQREEGGGGKEEDDEVYLDRLLLVQSDLSSVTRQIDELVAQVFRVKPSKQGKREIESFSLVLSDMLSSLKTWVPRLEKVLSCPASENKSQLAPSLPDKKFSAVNEDETFEVESPDCTTMDSLISPSPLVSWRAEGNIGRGRQLFLLTPLSLSKTLSSKCRDLSKSAHESIVSNPAVEVPSFLAVSIDVNDDSPEGIAVKPTPNNPSASVVTKAETAQNFESSVSSPTFFKNDHSMFVMTPCLKTSPPKTCMLLEPISETCHKGKAIARKSTPFPVGIHQQDSESSSGSESSDDLALKYPELLGIQFAYKSKMGKKDLEASPNWSFSPPKTCVLLRQSDEKPLDSYVTDNHSPTSVPVLNPKKELIVSKGCNGQGDSHQIKKPCDKEIVGGKLTLIESTPIWKEPESSMRIGKRPGENTLKKELWTRFEAASAYAIHVDVSPFPRTEHKGFLDMLDEVSLDGENTSDDGLR